ncbi:MAG: class I SAM-dependent methyltransferase [Lachnospiraceae bacterium]|nr:class I SAM-dependent methyltransferase [Lachnospiraceae bacterium]
MVTFSEKNLKEIYSRMNMIEHNWTKGTLNEVKFIKEYGENNTILDLGCGYGRHAIALAQSGAYVTAVDFSQEIICEAKKIACENLSEISKCSFVCHDAREYYDGKAYDKVICLFDVIGSFPDDKDNIKIIETAYRNLKINGIFILSVMNLELTETLVYDANKGNLQKNSNIIRRLPTSCIMQTNGNIFKSEFLALDTETGIVYRKERFSYDDSLSDEYIIRDRRYKLDEIKSILKLQGFETIIGRYVRAGHFDEPLSNTDKYAKEICAVARKVNKRL